MREVRCSRCGAVFTVQSDDAVCPSCGSAPVSRLSTIFSFVATHWLMFLLIAAFLAIERPSAQAWAVITFFLALVALGFIWFGLGRIGKSRSKEPSLDLGTMPRAETRPDPLITPMRPPKVPEKWRALVASRPPREVYLPPNVWKGFLAEGATLLFTLYVYSSKASKHHLSPAQFLSTFIDPANLGLVLVYALSWGVRLKKLLTTRSIVRDGEVTIAYTTDRSWNRATYRFWTQTGESFERRTTIVQRPDIPGEFTLVPVFYMLQDPRKSVALYGTEFRVRLAEDESAQQLQKVAAEA